MSLAQSNILEFIEGRGKVSKTETFTQFELCGKRVVEDALAALLERRLIIMGTEAAGPVYAPARARRNVPVPAPTAQPAAPVAKAPPQKTSSPQVSPEPGPLTTRQRVLALFEQKPKWLRLEIFNALADINKSTLHGMLALLVRSRVIIQSFDSYCLRIPNTPSEAQREDSAETTTELPATVATSCPVGDALVESAEAESPPPVIEPAAASQQITEVFGEEYATTDTVGACGGQHYIYEFAAITADLPVALWPGIKDREGVDYVNMNAEDDQLFSDARLAAMQQAGITEVPATAPGAVFAMETPKVSVKMTGDPKTVMGLVALISDALDE